MNEPVNWTASTAGGETFLAFYFLLVARYVLLAAFDILLVAQFFCTLIVTFFLLNNFVSLAFTFLVHLLIINLTICLIRRDVLLNWEMYNRNVQKAQATQGLGIFGRRF